MKRRSHICTNCWKVERVLQSYSDQKKHCGEIMKPLTYEQGYLAVRLDPKTRMQWYERGGYILKGPTKKKRWIPAMTDQEIEEAIAEKENHVKKKPRSRLRLSSLSTTLMAIFSLPEKKNKSNKRLLFLDDRGKPSDYVNDMSSRDDVDENLYRKEWHIVRSYDEFINWVRQFGVPDLVSFDYDLGDFTTGNVHGFTGLDCAKWLINYCKDNSEPRPKIIVHSTNQEHIDDFATLFEMIEQK